ncbi:hypothetical protein BGZ65_011234, partial [Modicella reniformis]
MSLISKMSSNSAVVPNMASRVKALEIATASGSGKTGDNHHHQHHQHHHQHHQHHHHHNHRLLHKYKRFGDEYTDSDDSDDSATDACCPRSPVTLGPSPTLDDTHSLARLLKNNRMWSKAIRERQPDFFEKCSKGQQPKVFWIGCSDSRVPENELLQL